MPRCVICDYASETYSICNDGLTDGNRPRRFVADRDGNEVCTVCSGSITDAISEDYLDENGWDRERKPNLWGKFVNEE